MLNRSLEHWVIQIRKKDITNLRFQKIALSDDALWRGKDKRKFVAFTSFIISSEGRSVSIAGTEVKIWDGRSGKKEGTRAFTAFLKAKPEDIIEFHANSHCFTSKMKSEFGFTVIPKTILINNKPI